MDAATAREDLALLVAADIEPALTGEELDRLVELSRQPDVDGILPDTYQPWRSITPYLLDDVVVPEPRNGHAYKVTIAGSSDTTAPSWPTDSAATVADGTVTWAEAGSALWAPTYDLNAAASQAWRLKAAKTATWLDFTADGASFKRSSVLAACLQMSQLYQRRSLGQIDLPVPKAPRRRVGTNVWDDRLDLDEFPLRDSWARAVGLEPEQLP